MAVTITALQLAAELRISDGTTALIEPQASIISRVLGTATAIVERYAPNAPESIQNEAVVRLAAFLYDAPPGSSTRFVNAFDLSGAKALLASYRSLRASAIETDEERTARMRQ